MQLAHLHQLRQYVTNVGGCVPCQERAWSSFGGGPGHLQLRGYHIGGGQIAPHGSPHAHVVFHGPAVGARYGSNESTALPPPQVHVDLQLEGAASGGVDLGGQLVLVGGITGGAGSGNGSALSTGLHCC